MKISLENLYVDLGIKGLIGPLWSQLFCLRAWFHGKLCLLFFSQLVANQFREVLRELQDRLKKTSEID